MRLTYWAAPAAIALLAGLSSCQSLSKDECLVADWQVIGENDGAAGQDPQGRFAQHVKACARVNVVPDQTLWNQGYKTGLVRYCTPRSGLQAGRSGKAYHNVCPVETQDGFLRGYNLGHAAYSKQSSINSLTNRINSLEYQIEQAKGGSKKKGSKKWSKDEVKRMRRQVHDLQRDRDDLERDLDLINRDIDWFNQDPNASIPSRYY